MDTPKKLTFALAGQIVSDSQRAKKILRAALVTGKGWLVPQARSVFRQLQSNGQ